MGPQNGDCYRQMVATMVVSSGLTVLVYFSGTTEKNITMAGQVSLAVCRG